MRSHFKTCSQPASSLQYVVLFLCVSAVFAVARCHSVRLSRWCIVSRRLKISSNFFLGHGSPTILVFWSPAPIPNSKGNSFSGDAKYKGWEHFAIFDWNCRLSRKWYERGPWMLWNVNRKSYTLYRIVTFSMTLTDPKPGFQGHGTFEVKYLKNLGTKLL